jgi:hypothetical protein
MPKIVLQWSECHIEANGENVNFITYPLFLGFTPIAHAELHPEHFHLKFI